MQTSLILHNFRLSVKLGVTEEERSCSQEVWVTLKIGFSEPPLACVSDELSDTVDYTELVKICEERCRGQEFKLIEKLAAELLRAVQNLLPDGGCLKYLRITKHYPMAELPQSEFSIGEE